MDKGQISIRRIGTNEVDALQAISIATFKHAFEADNTEENMRMYIESAFSKASLLGELNNPESFFYFVYLAEQVIGYMKLNIGAAQTDLQGENGLEICRIYVDHRFQGLRLGQQLIDLAFHTAKEMKVAFVWLGVWEKNAGAIRFYERNGFETISKHDFWLGTDRQTDHIMRCLL